MVEPIQLESLANAHNNIDIQLSQNFFWTGQQIQGYVYLKTGNQAADKLKLTLKGTSSVELWRRHILGTRRYIKRERNDEPFAKVTLTLKEFNSRQTPSGKSCYSFSMALPEDLPATNFMNNWQVKSLCASTRYMLAAELISNDEVVMKNEIELPLYRKADNSKFAP